MSSAGGERWSNEVKNRDMKVKENREEKGHEFESQNIFVNARGRLSKNIVLLIPYTSEEHDRITVLFRTSLYRMSGNRSCSTRGFDGHDDLSHIASNRPSSLFPSAMNPFSMLDPSFTRSIFDSGPVFRGGELFVSHPREVRQIPNEVKDGPSTESDHSGRAPRIEDVTETARENDSETPGVMIIDDDDDDCIPTYHRAGRSVREGLRDTRLRPSAPEVGDLPDYGIEEEMIRAAIEASKQDSQIG
ncbi:hypothetical protein Tco_1100638 [Tanacetum coccineum]